MSRYPSAFITAHIDIGVLQHLERGNDLAIESDPWISEICSPAVSSAGMTGSEGPSCGRLGQLRRSPCRSL